MSDCLDVKNTSNCVCMNWNHKSFLSAVHFHPTCVRLEKRRFQRFVEMRREKGRHNRSVISECRRRGP